MNWSLSWRIDRIDRIKKAPVRPCIFEILPSLAGLEKRQHIGD